VASSDAAAPAGTRGHGGWTPGANPPLPPELELELEPLLELDALDPVPELEPEPVELPVVPVELLDAPELAPLPACTSAAEQPTSVNTSRPIVQRAMHPPAANHPRTAARRKVGWLRPGALAVTSRGRAL